jgi:hypothetical protein
MGTAQPEAQPSAQPQVSQQLLQVLQDFLHLWQPKMSSRQRWHFLWQHFFAQQLSQAGWQPQAGSAAQPQAAGAAQPQSFAAAQPQSFAAAQPHAAGAAQAGSQAAAQPPQVLQLLHDFLQHLWQPKMPWCKPPNRPPQQRFLWQHFFWQHESQAFAQPQLGSTAQHDGASAAQQVGSAAQQAGSQPLSQPQAGSHDWQQLLQPQSFRPSMRSRSSKPKLWLHRPTLTTSAPKTIFHFIEQRLLYLNCG